MWFYINIPICDWMSLNFLFCKFKAHNCTNWEIELVKTNYLTMFERNDTLFWKLCQLCMYFVYAVFLVKKISLNRQRNNTSSINAIGGYNTRNTQKVIQNILHYLVLRYLKLILFFNICIFHIIFEQLQFSFLREKFWFFYFFVIVKNF